MAIATTEEFDEMVLETGDGASPEVWTKICGLIDVTVTRSANMDTAEVPDCADESLPLSLEQSVRSIQVSVSATGVWASESHELLSDWFYLSTRKNFRIGNTAAASGDTEYESGAGYISSLTNTRTKGSKVSASIEMMFDGTPTRTAKA